MIANALNALSTTFHLLTSSVSVNPAFEIIQQQHLDTPDGRVHFLTHKLKDFVLEAKQLNEEVCALAKQIEALSPEDDQQKILHLTSETAQKMKALSTMLSALELAQFVEEDLKQVDAILHQSDPLSLQQKEVLDRLISLCQKIETLPYKKP